jgi:hypothetical protein
VVSVVSRPSGARVTRNGAAVGSAPVVLRAPEGETLALELSALGYRPTTVAIQARCPDTVQEIALDPERGFEGIWQIPTGALRLFERNEGEVAAYLLETPQSMPRFLRLFKFQPQTDDGLLRFAADEEVVDPRAPDAPSCRTQLRAEYRYDPARDRLELRRQQADISFRGGTCVVEKSARWTEFQPVTRIGGRDLVIGTLSSQGAGASPPPEEKPTKVAPNLKKRPNQTKQEVKQPPPANDEPLQLQNQAPPALEQANPPSAPQFRK